MGRRLLFSDVGPVNRLDVCNPRFVQRDLASGEFRFDLGRLRLGHTARGLRVFPLHPRLLERLREVGNPTGRVGGRRLHGRGLTLLSFERLAQLGQARSGLFIGEANLRKFS